MNAEGARRILLVEDSPTQALRLQHFLEQRGFEIEQINTAEAALERLNTQRPDLLIVDLNLPGMSGYELCRRLRMGVNTRGILILLLTSAEEAAVETRAFESGADDFALKSEDYERLLLRIHALLRQSQVTNVPTAAEPLLASAKVLIVEDSPTYAQLLAGELEAEGYQLTIAGTGGAALEHLASKPFDAMILDLVLPDMTGLEVCQRIAGSRRAAESTFMILVLTGESLVESMSKLIEAGADDVIGKSRDMGVIKARLHSLVRRKILLEENRRIRREFQAREHALLQERAERQTAEARAALVDEIEQASRSKSAFLANMSHELRTPLNAIIGFSDLLMLGSSGELSPRQRKFVDYILESGKQLLALISDILDLSKIEAGKVEVEFDALDLKALLDESLTLIGHRAQTKQIRLQLEADGLAGLFLADRTRLKQILDNLLSNAVKFTPTDGRVSVRAAVVDRAQAAAGLPGFKAGTRMPLADSEFEQFVEISVTDTGIGMRPEDARQLFTPFTQIANPLSRASEGTGLGLAMVRKLAELHEGTVAVSSESGRGSCFTVWLPWRSGPKQPAQQAARVEPPPPVKAGGPLALVVEATKRQRP